MKVAEVIAEINQARERADLYGALIGYVNEALPSDTGEGPDALHPLQGFTVENLESAVECLKEQQAIWTSLVEKYERSEIDGSAED